MYIKIHDPTKHDIHKERETQCAQFTLLLVENRGEMRKRHPFQFFDGSGLKELLNFVKNELFQNSFARPRCPRPSLACAAVRSAQNAFLNIIIF